MAWCCVGRLILRRCCWCTYALVASAAAMAAFVFHLAGPRWRETDGSLHVLHELSTNYARVADEAAWRVFASAAVGTGASAAMLCWLYASGRWGADRYQRCAGARGRPAPPHWLKRACASASALARTARAYAQWHGWRLCMLPLVPACVMYALLLARLLNDALFIVLRFALRATEATLLYSIAYPLYGPYPDVRLCPPSASCVSPLSTHSSSPPVATYAMHAGDAAADDACIARAHACIVDGAMDDASNARLHALIAALLLLLPHAWALLAWLGTYVACRYNHAYCDGASVGALK